jgi:hypothetical protein
MKSPNGEPKIKMPESRLEEAAKIISDSPGAIEKEFARTANDWLSCVGSRIFQLECLFSSEKAKMEVGVDTFNEINKKLENVKSKLFVLKEQYPNKDFEPSEAVKKEILSMLNIL